MKTKILITALSCLFINAASAEAPVVSGNVGAKYASDYHRRGAVLSEEAIQAQVGFNIGVGAVDLFGDIFTNQNSESAGNDTDEVTLGLSTELMDDVFSAYLGVYNTDTGVGDSDLEAFASLRANTFLSPTLSVYRDTDDSLYTYEGQLSYDVDLDLVALELAGILGNTDTGASADRAYYGAKLTASKTIKDNLNMYADVALSDSDDRDNETVWGVGLSVKF
jgi:hypothetical protein